MISSVIKLSENALNQVSANNDEVELSAAYSDEISAYRAKRSWATTLNTFFLLESNHDFTVRVLESSGYFKLICHFGSACGRYAFWRLTNNQAPDAYSLLELAHIPLRKTGHSSSGGITSQIISLRPTKLAKAMRRLLDALGTTQKEV